MDHQYAELQSKQAEITEKKQYLSTLRKAQSLSPEYQELLLIQDYQRRSEQTAEELQRKIAENQKLLSSAKALYNRIPQHNERLQHLTQSLYQLEQQLSLIHI